MTATRVSLDTGLACFLGDVLIQFDRALQPEPLREAMLGWGFDEAAAEAVSQHLAAHAGDLASLRTALPGITNALATGSLNAPRLALDVGAAWKGLDAVLGSAPVLSPDAALPGFNVLDRLMSLVADNVLKVHAPLAWTLGVSLGLFGAGSSPFAALGQAFDNPLQFALARLLAHRRELRIRIAGLLSGPRTTAMSTADLGEGLPVSAQVKATMPAAERVAQRLSLRFATDTYEEGWPLTLDVLTDAASAYVGLALTAGPLVDGPLRLGKRLSLGLAPLDAPMSVVLTGAGAIQPVLPAPPALDLSLGDAASLPMFLLGAEDGAHLSLSRPLLQVRLAAAAWNVRGGFESFEVAIPRGIGGPVLGMLLPAGGVKLAGRVVFVLDGKGLHAEGGIGLVVRSSEVVRLPALTLSDLTTAVELRPGGFGLRSSGTLSLRLGPLAVTVEGLGVGLAIDVSPEGRGNLGIVELGAPSVTVPTGFGLSIDTPTLRGGGFLRKLDDGSYAGAMELALQLGPASIAVKAYGIFGTVERALSFVVVISIEFAPPIELFLGLTLNGVGGVFGFNRSVDAPAIGDLVRMGQADQLLFPADLVARAPAIIDSVRRVFPAKRDQLVVGPMLKLGWGRPTSFVTATVGLIVTAPNPALVVFVGRLSVMLPEEKLAVMQLRADFVGAIDLASGNTSFDASLVDSRIGTFTLGGDLALRAGPQGFVFTAGGFHPKFPPPASVGAVRRLSVDISPGPLLKLWAEAYVAVTASSVQFGARAFVRAELGPIEAHGHLGFDALVRTTPRLAFLVEVSGEFALSVDGTRLLTARLAVLLEGPGRWHARAHASIDILFFEVSGTLDLAWGDALPAELLPAKDPAQVARDALAQDRAWCVSLPVEAAAVARLREGAQGLHPLGQLRLTQTAVPLSVAVQRIGNNPVSSNAPVRLTVNAPGSGIEPATELFALAQFFELSDDERLSRPAFAPYEAGVVLKGTAWDAGAGLAGDLTYEESLGDESRSRFHVAVDERLQQWLGASVTVRALAPAEVRAPKPPPLRVTPPRWAVADARSGAVVPNSLSATGAVLTAVPSRSVEKIVLADFELAA